jgi:D-glycero-D-manno-heptose 1,7-bisphosphate phosphatase
MAVTSSAAAVFLDKDGTLVENVPYNVNPDKIRLVPGAGEALCAMAGAGYRLFVVSNQSGVARGLFRESALAAVQARLKDLLSQHGLTLSGFYYCPHHPQGKVTDYATECTCRKPQPGLLLAAADQHGIDLAGSWLVGDILDDVEAGRRAGCRTILVDNGHETEWRMSEERRPHHTVADLPSAARIIAEDPR